MLDRKDLLACYKFATWTPPNTEEAANQEHAEVGVERASNGLLTYYSSNGREQLMITSPPPAPKETPSRLSFNIDLVAAKVKFQQLNGNIPDNAFDVSGWPLLPGKGCFKIAQDFKKYDYSRGNKNTWYFTNEHVEHALGADMEDLLLMPYFSSLEIDGRCLPVYWLSPLLDWKNPSEKVWQPIKGKKFSLNDDKAICVIAVTTNFKSDDESIEEVKAGENLWLGLEYPKAPDTDSDPAATAPEPAEPGDKKTLAARTEDMLKQAVQKPTAQALSKASALSRKPSAPASPPVSGFLTGKPLCSKPPTAQQTQPLSMPSPGSKLIGGPVASSKSAEESSPLAGPDDDDDIFDDDVYNEPEK
jgi:hypothetical protein